MSRLWTDNGDARSKDTMARNSAFPTNLLLASDLSARSDRALDRAIGLAREWKARLTIVHALDVVDVPNDRPSAAAGEHARIRALHLMHGDLGNATDVARDFVVAEGKPADVVLRVAHEKAIDLILTGIAGNNPLVQSVLGNTTTALVRKAAVPVLVVKKRGLKPYSRVVVASDLSEASIAALETALQLFVPSRITLYHVFDMPFRGLVDDKAAYEQDARRAALEAARTFARNHLGSRADEIAVEVAPGDAPVAIADHAARADVDLVIAGSHGRTGLLNVLLGSIAVALLDEVSCDVMIVPSVGPRRPS